MDSINLKEVKSLADQLQKIATVLEHNPLMGKFMEFASHSKDIQLVMPDLKEAYVRAGTVCEMFSINKNVLSKYVNEGLIKAYKLPHSQEKRFKLSEVEALIQEVG